MGFLDFLFGKKHAKCSGCGSSIHKDSSLCINCQILKEAEKRKPKVKKTTQNTSSKQREEFNKTEQSDLRIYAMVRCFGEIMTSDGEAAPEEVFFFGKFSKEEQEKLSKPYSQESKEFKFIWGSNWTSPSSNRKNLISVLKSFKKKDLDMFLEKLIVMTVADKEIKHGETNYLRDLYTDIYDMSANEAMDMVKANFRRLKLIK